MYCIGQTIMQQSLTATPAHCRVKSRLHAATTWYMPVGPTQQIDATISTCSLITVYLSYTARLFFEFVNNWDCIVGRLTAYIMQHWRLRSQMTWHSWCRSWWQYSPLGGWPMSLLSIVSIISWLRSNVCHSLTGTSLLSTTIASRKCYVCYLCFRLS